MGISIDLKSQFINKEFKTHYLKDKSIEYFTV